MRKVRLALIGVNGYGSYMIQLLEEIRASHEGLFSLIGVVDPYAGSAPLYEVLLNRGIPVYETIEALYEEQQVDALYIISPPVFHKGQCEYGLARGSVVLCEKPLAVCIQDIAEIQAAEARHHGKAGVGYQWCYTDGLLAAKQDILDGKFGKPVMLKCLASWMRGRSYYDSLWHGKFRMTDGSYVLDSVVSNALSHYLHTIFFLLGDRMDASLEPWEVKAGLYRIKNIESFDTCTLKGKFNHGAQFLFLGSHSGDYDIHPQFEYRFENGVLYLDENKDGELRAIMKDGTKHSYGKLSGREYEKAKLLSLFAVARGEGDFPCKPAAVLPERKVVNLLFEKCPITDFPREEIDLSSEEQGGVAPGLNAVLQMCCQLEKTPGELGMPWAEETAVKTEGYGRFSGIYGELH